MDYSDILQIRKKMLKKTIKSLNKKNRKKKVIE